MLLLAGTYKNAVGRELWRGRPGMTWSSYYAFLADDPERRHTEPVEFGNAWTRGGLLEAMASCTEQRHG